jgi:hypothetical protein
MACHLVDAGEHVKALETRLFGQRSEWKRMKQHACGVVKRKVQSRCHYCRLRGSDCRRARSVVTIERCWFWYDPALLLECLHLFARH